MKKIIFVAGARPNFMKVAPILREIEKRPQMASLLVHTGQHYDNNMSESFFVSLGIKDPDHFLGVGSGTHAVQTAKIMLEFEKVCLEEQPDSVVVVGDVNSTVAAGLVAKKLDINLAHVEAGLRSGDRTMPEEINRLATDAISDLFFATEKAGRDNLLHEGQPQEKVHFVGHVMIDNLYHQLNKVEEGLFSERAAYIKSRLPEKYLCVTLHRPSNVDDKEILERLLDCLSVLAEDCPVVFPCHPRTRSKMSEFGLSGKSRPFPDEGGDTLEKGLYTTEPLAYNDFLYVWKDAAAVLTDSGGLQEETTALKIPCITLRQNTERPITAEIGTNVVVGNDKDRIIGLGKDAINGHWKKSRIPELWDGEASARVVNILRRYVP